MGARGLAVNEEILRLVRDFDVSVCRGRRLVVVAVNARVN
jgi:hypothetical protein